MPLREFLSSTWDHIQDNLFPSASASAPAAVARLHDHVDCILAVRSRRGGSLVTAPPMGALRDPPRDIESSAGFPTLAVVRDSCMEHDRFQCGFSPPKRGYFPHWHSVFSRWGGDVNPLEVSWESAWNVLNKSRKLMIAVTNENLYEIVPCDICSCIERSMRPIGSSRTSGLARPVA
jgi:hypothetical protein